MEMQVPNMRKAGIEGIPPIQTANIFEYLLVCWFKIGKGVCQGCILSLCLFNLYAEYILQNAGLDKSQAGMDCQETYQQPLICR